MLRAGNVAAIASPFHGWRFFNCPRPGKSKLKKTAIADSFHCDEDCFEGSVASFSGTALNPGLSSIMICILPLPSLVKRKPCENQEQANRGAAGAIQPDIYGKRERACHEQARNPGIAPAAVGARQMRFGLAHSKERDDREGVKDPGGKNKKIGQLFECSR